MRPWLLPAHLWKNLRTWWLETPEALAIKENEKTRFAVLQICKIISLLFAFGEGLMTAGAILMAAHLLGPVAIPLAFVIFAATYYVNYRISAVNIPKTIDSLIFKKNEKSLKASTKLISATLAIITSLIFSYFAVILTQVIFEHIGVLNALGPEAAMFLLVLIGVTTFVSMAALFYQGMIDVVSMENKLEKLKNFLKETVLGLKDGTKLSFYKV